MFDNESFAACNVSFVTCNGSSGVRSFVFYEKSLSFVLKRIKGFSHGNCKVLYLLCFVEVLSFV